MRKLLFILSIVLFLDTNAQLCFSLKTNYATDFYCNSLTCADFNADGVPDLATTNQSGNNISILLGSGGGSFGAPVNISVDFLPNSITNSDFDGDGIVDLA